MNGCFERRGLQSHQQLGRCTGKNLGPAQDLDLDAAGIFVRCQARLEGAGKVAGAGLELLQAFCIGGGKDMANHERAADLGAALHYQIFDGGKPSFGQLTFTSEVYIYP